MEIVEHYTQESIQHPRQSNAKTILASWGMACTRFPGNMTPQWNYSPSRHELTISNPSLTISHFVDKVDHESMMINMDSKTTIDELHEDGVPVILKKTSL